MNRFIIDTAIVYLKNEYLVYDEESSRKLLLAINAIGNNVNQIIHKLHLTVFQISKNTYTSDISMESLYRLLDGYESLKRESLHLMQELKGFMDSPPPNILNLSWNEVRSNKDKLDQLIAFLENQKKGSR